MKFPPWFLVIVICLVGSLGESAFAQGAYCNRAWGEDLCPLCGAEPGRAYTLVGGYCTVCPKFCPFWLAAPDDQSHNPTNNGKREAKAQNLSTNEPLLFIRVDNAAVYSLAAANPQAAMLLKVLEIRSNTTDAVAPAKGDGGSQRLATPESAMMAFENRDERDFAVAMTPFPDSVHRSAMTWELVRTPTQSVLSITHRLLNKSGEVIGIPFPDVDVELRWMPTESGGYWLTTGWKERS